MGERKKRKRKSTPVTGKGQEKIRIRGGQFKPSLGKK